MIERDDSGRMRTLLDKSAPVSKVSSVAAEKRSIPTETSATSSSSSGGARPEPMETDSGQQNVKSSSSVLMHTDRSERQDRKRVQFEKSELSSSDSRQRLSRKRSAETPDDQLELENEERRSFTEKGAGLVILSDVPPPADGSMDVEDANAPAVDMSRPNATSTESAHHTRMRDEKASVVDIASINLRNAVRHRL